MNKIKIWNKIKEYKYVIGIILISILVFSGYSFFIDIKEGDAIWNFSNIYKMYNGGKIYNDCNTVQTPIFFYVGMLLFKILKANFITFGIYNILIFLFLEILIYKLFYILNSNHKRTFFESLIMLIYITTMVPGSANYNTLVLCFVVLGIIINIKYEDKKYITLLQGTIFFLTTFTKQNIGVFYIVAISIYNLVIGITNKNIKKYIKIIINEIMIFLILLGISLIGMYFYGNLNQFINYTILGISDFANKNLMTTANIIITEILTMIFMILITFVTVKIFNIGEKEKKNLLLIFIIAIFMMIYMYPIFNSYHIMLGNFLISIIIIYWIDIVIKEVKINQIIIKIFYIISYLIAIVISSIGIYYSVSAYKVCNKEESIYKGACLSEENTKKIKNICQYIEDKQKNNIDVKIISYKAMLYTTPLKINNNEFDLPLNGNFGKEGVKGLIDKMSKFKNTEILITKDPEDRNYQEPIELREYVIENFEKIGEIEEFYIYKTPIYEEQ